MGNQLVVLASNTADGLLCKTEDGHLIMSTEFNEGEKFEGKLKTFNGFEEAEDWVLQTCSFNLFPEMLAV